MKLSNTQAKINWIKKHQEFIRDYLKNPSDYQFKRVGVKAIVRGLKAAKLVAESTYYVDVRVENLLKETIKQLKINQ